MSNALKSSRRWLRLLPFLLALLAGGAFVFSTGALADHKEGHTKGAGNGGGGNDDGGDSGTQYSVVDLGSDEETGGFRAEALNNFGGVIKNRNGLDELWELGADETILEVRSLPGLVGAPQSTWANDINDEFVICGSAEVVVGEETPPQAVAWDAAGDQVVLIGLPLPDPEPGFFPVSSAEGVSENGLICGFYFERISGESGLYNRKAFVWQVTQNGISTVELPNGVEARDVNSDGIVIGRQPIAGGAVSIWVLQFDEAGVLVGASDPIALPGLGGPPIDAFEISDSGVIAGEAWTSTDEHHAALWLVDATGQLIGIDDLGLPGNNDRAGAVGTNNLGEAVVNGFRDVRTGTTIGWEPTPYLADTTGTLTDLNRLDMDLGDLKELRIALDINDLGWISGTAATQWTSNAFVAIPVP